MTRGGCAWTAAALPAGCTSCAWWARTFPRRDASSWRGEKRGKDALPARTSPARSAFAEKVRAAILERLTNPALTVEALAEAMALSRVHLYRRLKQEAGVTPSRLIRTVRVERAAALLEEQAGTVSEVAYAVGFESLSHFSRSFKEHFDVTPSAYGERV